MNIEEAIKIVKKIRQDYNLYYPMDRKEVEAVETLLTAYEQKCNYIKENEIYKKNLFDNYEEKCKELEKEKEENMSYYYHIQGLEDDIRMHYISTYKIEKEIKKIKDSNTYGYVGEEWNDRDVVELLENLISKEE